MQYIDEIAEATANLNVGFESEGRELLNKFNEDTKSEDELQVVLRGHLYLEHEIEKLLRFVLVEPDYILTNRFMFMNKVNLGVALGLIPEELAKVYEKLNRLRNNFAHKLDFKITDKNLDDIVSRMNENMRSMCSISCEQALLEKVKSVISLIWMDAMFRVFQYELNNYAKELQQVNDLMMMKVNPLSHEELEKRGSRVLEKINKRFPNVDE